MNFLIAPWGNPKGWKEVTYCFKGKKCKTPSSLKALAEFIKPKNIIVIGLSTIAKKGKSYKEVKECAKDEIKHCISEFGLDVRDVFIAPGTGSFPNGIFKGDALDYYYYIIAKLILKLNEVLKDKNENWAIYLDLTHGVNYTTVLTYRAVKEIVGVLSIFKDVHFKTYNADPSVPFTESTVANLNVIESSESTPMPYNEKIESKNLLEPLKEDQGNLFVIESIKEVDISEVSAFIGALYNGLPLALYTFYPDAEKLKKVIEETLAVYESSIKVRQQDENRIEVTRSIRLTKNFKAVVFAFFIAVLLKSRDLVLSSKREITLEDVRTLNRKLFKFDERIRARIDSDVFSLSEKVKDKEIDDWKLYRDVLSLSSVEEKRRQRNFLAHSGFERNSIEIKKEDNKPWLRYSENAISRVKELCQSGLK